MFTTIHRDANRLLAKLRCDTLIVGSALGILLTLTAASATTSAQGCALVENVASGRLGNWTLSGRQQGTWTANVVSRGGSRTAHLYHRGFTEVTIRRRFGYHKAASAPPTRTWRGTR